MINISSSLAAYFLLLGGQITHYFHKGPYPSTTNKHFFRKDKMTKIKLLLIFLYCQHYKPSFQPLSKGRKATYTYKPVRLRWHTLGSLSLDQQIPLNKKGKHSAPSNASISLSIRKMQEGDVGVMFGERWDLTLILNN